MNALRAAGFDCSPLNRVYTKGRHGYVSENRHGRLRVQLGGNKGNNWKYMEVTYFKLTEPKYFKRWCRTHKQLRAVTLSAFYMQVLNLLKTPKAKVSFSSYVLAGNHDMLDEQEFLPSVLKLVLTLTTPDESRSFSYVAKDHQTAEFSLIDNDRGAEPVEKFLRHLESMPWAAQLIAKHRRSKLGLLLSRQHVRTPKPSLVHEPSC